MKIHLICLLAFALVQSVSADERFYDRQNRYVGKAVESGNETRYYDRVNRYLGKAVVSGKVTRYYDRANRLSSRSQIQP